MDRKPKPDTYVEPMPRREFLRLMKAFEAIGGKYIADEQSEQYLNIKGVEACTLNATTILFKKRPTRAAVYEELYHAQQYRDGRIDGTVVNMYQCEIETQRYLLDKAKELSLTKNEIQQTKNALNWYENRLRKMKGDDSRDNM